MAKSRFLRNKRARSVVSELPWRNDNPFGPPQVPRSFPNGGIRRLRNTLSKLSPSAFAEKELLRKKNQYKIPLTRRNVDNFVTKQECNEACQLNQRTPEIQVAEWLEHVSCLGHSQGSTWLLVDPSSN
ncbi:uncharacterized protein N7482_005715 [Penicillium canariense]|uniref:Uncharacterized protein n=1 Tax=Penicillium canariense TaxID=189055 RepID=A0A9W9I2W3_9EURO|nr:uncharacterized protein N7482_005715 [Penicillium canariense]KAJ5166934.1 hypothetical protein N7482_005715 [Penicillium canariense]